MALVSIQIKRELLKKKSNELDVPIVSSTHWAHGGKGAEELAKTVVETIESSDNNFNFLYPDEMPLWDKMETIAKKIWRLKHNSKCFSKKQIEELQNNGYGEFPVCVAKTQYSFSTDPSLRGAPDNHEIPIREVRLSAGAEFIVMVCGDIMTMPGLPKIPAAERIDIDDDGNIVGLF